MDDPDSLELVRALANNIGDASRSFVVADDNLEVMG
jgi:hypothetical protein